MTEATQIIEIKKQTNKASKYVLKVNELQKLLQPVIDKNVSLISIAGPSRQGKSFLLSYMIRYLTNPLDVNWIGDESEPLKGFGWKTDLDPQTSGIWLSNPFLVKQSNGKEIAVILMDTQGVFDEFASQRDWSTIVGISLLSSSCLVFNIFNNLQEDILKVLESFLEYGLLAVESNGNNSDYPFQNLMFLIRDWNLPAVCKYGQTGGQLFLDRKLEIKEDQSPSAQTARRLIKKCFEEFGCFLMPDPGDKAKEDIEFNGSVSELTPRFVDKMKEFITNLLNPEELKQKTINNNCINAGELIQYLKAYVDVFNSDELPNPVDIVEATAKTADLITINKLKDMFEKQMENLLLSKNFIERKVLESFNNELNTKLLVDFKSKKKTNNKDIERDLFDSLNESLKSLYKHIFNQNEQRREKTLTDESDKLSINYNENMQTKLESIFVEPIILEDMHKKEKKLALETFNKVYGQEDKNLCATFILKLTTNIDNFEANFKAENFRRIAEAEKFNSNAVTDSIETFRQAMKSLFEKYLFLNNEEFIRYGEEIQLNCKQLFSENCTYGDSKFIKQFENEFEKKLIEIKSEFKSLNKTKKDKILINTNLEMTKCCAEYNKQMNEFLENICSEEILIDKHNEIKHMVSDQFQENCEYKSQAFLKPYLQELNKDLDKTLSDLKLKLTEKIERFKKQMKNSVNESRDLYLKEFSNLFNGEEFYTQQELEEYNNEIKNKAISYFESNTNLMTNIENDSYLSDLKNIMNDEFNKIKQNNKRRRDFKEQNLEVITNECVSKYEDQMEEFVESVDNESQLIEKHEKVRDQIINDFKALNPFGDMELFMPYLEKLEDRVNDSLKDLIDVFNLELKNQAINSKTVISEAKKFYKEEMSKYYQKTSFIAKDKLQQYNELVINLTMNKFESERANMSFEKFEKLINESLAFEFEKIKQENDMNAPAIPAIGIDLGTTNSCVAYFKPDRKNGNTFVIPNELGKNTTASVVAFTDSGEMVGDVAKEEAFGNPRNTIFLAKRLIGRQFNDVSVKEDMKHWAYKVIDDGKNNPKFSVQHKGKNETYFPEQISAKILKKMKQIAETHLGFKVTNAVITVPAYFNDAQKEATKDAGEIAGLNVLKIINEPTAAAIAFKLNKNEERDYRKVLIYDFGGGTFDVAVLVIDRGNIDIKAVGGDNHLGGDDFDTILVKYCLDEFEEEFGLVVRNDTNEGQRALSRLRTRCEEQKCNLSSVDSTTITIDNFFDSEDLRVDISRQKFEKLSESLFIKSMNLVQQTLDDAEINNSDIDDVVLVGGSTRIPRIQEMLSDLFGGKPLNHVINADEAVAVGAAIQAAILNGSQAQGLGQLKVSDVAPMSLGVKVVGGFMSVIIPRNSKVPNTYSNTYETSADYQTSVEIEIYEGEEQMVDKNRLLGKFTLTGIPSALKGEQSLNVIFDINDEGILHVKAKIASTGGEEEIEINEHKGRLTDQELQNLIDQA